MKVTYKKLRKLKIFNIKIFEFVTDYIEHSTENETEDDEFFTNLNDRIIKNDGN